MLVNQRILVAAGVLVCVLLGSGCSSYYKVKDPQSGNVYYTQEVKQRNGGAVTLRDAASGDTVTIQNSQVQSISKERYLSEKSTSGQNPTAKAAEAKAAEQRAAEQQAAEARAAEQRAADARAADQRAAEQKLADAKAAEAKAANGKSVDANATDADAAIAGAAVGGAAAAKAASTPGQLRASLVAGKDQVDRTLASLTEMTDPNQANLNAAYKRYGDQVVRTKACAQQAKVDADGMRQAREAYFAKWDAKIATIDNPSIRTEAEAKRARLRDAQEKIAGDSALAKEAYQPFITDLEDTHKFLSPEPTKDAVSVLAPTVKKMQQDGTMLKQRLDTLIADLDAVEGKATTRPSAASADGAANGDVTKPALK